MKTLRSFCYCRVKVEVAFESGGRPFFAAALGLLVYLMLSGIGLSEAHGAPTLTGITPSVTQPDETVTIGFTEAVSNASVKIGGRDGAIQPCKGDPKKIEVRLARDVPAGDQQVTVTLSDGKTQVSGCVYVMPVIAGIKTSEKQAAPVRTDAAGVIVGSEILVQFGGPLPPGISPPDIKVAVGGVDATILDIRTDAVKVRVPDAYAENKGVERKKEEKGKKEVGSLWRWAIGNGPYPVTVSMRGTPLRSRGSLMTVYESCLLLSACVALLVVLGIIYLLCRFYKPLSGQKRPWTLEMLLLEQANRTYSLSRAQFLSWLVVIVWCYLYVFLARGFIDDYWTFPQIGNSAYVFFTSLGTLIVAQATSRSQGCKGAGQVAPSVSDLVVHGGVLALDRVQQVVWTVIALGIFVKITVETYLTATGLPEVPGELIGLMGLSSVSYLGGKLVRGAGPVIDQASVVLPAAPAAAPAGVVLNLKGRHLSKEAFIWMDGVRLSKECIKRVVDDLESPKEFAKEMDVDLSLSLSDWRAADHTITLINSDAQRADWRTGPEIIDVTPGPAAGNKVSLTIRGARLSSGATVTLGGAPDAKPVQDNKDPNLFTVEVDATWPATRPHMLTVMSGGEEGVYTY